MAEKQDRMRESDCSVVSCLLVLALVYVRECEDFLGAVSLRDVRRALQLTNFFLQINKYEEKIRSNDDGESPSQKKRDSENGLASAVALALALVFHFRLSNHKHREGFWPFLCGDNSIVHTFVSLRFL
jgi:hypothetical protein